MGCRQVQVTMAQAVAGRRSPCSCQFDGIVPQPGHQHCSQVQQYDGALALSLQGACPTRRHGTQNGQRRGRRMFTAQCCSRWHLSFEVATIRTLCCDMLAWLSFRNQSSCNVTHEETVAYVCDSTCDSDGASGSSPLDRQLCPAVVVPPDLAERKGQNFGSSRFCSTAMGPQAVTRYEEAPSFLERVDNMDAVWPAGTRTSLHDTAVALPCALRLALCSL